VEKRDVAFAGSSVVGAKLPENENKVSGKFI
jgi:hypothetical protein